MTTTFIVTGWGWLSLIIGICIGEAIFEIARILWRNR